MKNYWKNSNLNSNISVKIQNILSVFDLIDIVKIKNIKLNIKPLDNLFIKL